MKAFPGAWLPALCVSLALLLGACGGSRNDGKDATATLSNGATTSASGSATADSTPGSTAEGSASGTGADATSGSGGTATAAETPVPAATPVPTQNPEDITQFTQGIIGEAQQPLFYFQLISGDIDCTGACTDTVAQRWQKAVNACAAGRWDARRKESGYVEEIHGPLITALVESCKLVSDKFASGTPDDSDEWRDVVSAAIDLLDPQFDLLVEKTSNSGG